MMEVGDKLKEARISRNLTMDKLADILNKKYNLSISKSMISRWESGKNEPLNTYLGAYAKEFGLDMNWLLGLVEEPFLANCLIKVNYPKIKIPLVGTVKAGTPALAEENIEEYVELDKKIQADFALKVKGDSMINARIYENDIVFIRSQPDVEDGEIAVVLIGEEATLKRVYKMGGKIILRAENPAFDPIELDGTENVRILGKATYKLSRVL